MRLQVFQVQLSIIFLSFHRLHCIFVVFQGCMYMRILCFIGSWLFFVLFLFFTLFLLYFIFFSLIFYYSFTNFFNLFNCFERQQLLLVILSSLLVAAMSLLMQLRYKLIQLPIQVYKYNFSVIQILYIKQLTINTLILFWQKCFETTRGGKSYG